MCGISGEFYFNRQKNLRTATVQRLTRLMRRRGPDDEGIWSDGTNCTLGFRRLSILDLYATGHQPMTSGNRYVLVYNGEVYNFKELRHELEQKGIRFHSTGDTEVVLWALAEWGVSALSRFNGMFALAFFDIREKSLLLARDHAGIKPLYFFKGAKGLIFSSQFNTLIAHPWTHNSTISQHALSLYLQLGYLPAPYGLLEGSLQVEPGTWLKIQAHGDLRQGRFFEFPQYTDPSLHGHEAYEAVDAVITQAVKRQMISDVPIGTFLSGGIDSPLVSAKMQAIANNPIKSFTIGNRGDPQDESEAASRYAKDIGLNHWVQQATPETALTLLNSVIEACGEPIGDYSVFPTLLVSQVASQHVKVVLSGDGGDELFWGYAGRFSSVLRHSQDFKQNPTVRALRWGMKKLLHIGNGYYNLRWPTIGHWYKAKHTKITENRVQDIFPDLPGLPKEFIKFDYLGWKTDQTAQWLRWNEYSVHLPMVLQKVDRASMYHSLEVRVPLLDLEVIRVASMVDWQACLDLNTGMGKLPLRYAFKKHVENQTVKKHGFSVPMASWLRGPLQPIFKETLLNRNELLGNPINNKALSRLYGQHLSREIDVGWGLWVLLGLALWEAHHLNPLRKTICYLQND